MKRQNYIEKEDFFEIELSNCEDVCLIDKEDINIVNKFYWRKSNNGYVINSINNKSIHRIILNVINSKDFVDHLNGNPLDNRKVNLRITDNSGNMLNRQKLPTHNTTGHLGVIRSGNKFVARITINRKRIYLGIFSTIEKAIDARKTAEDKYLTFK